MIKKTHTKYIDETTGITAEFTADEKITLRTNKGSRDFTFLNSNRETVELVLESIRALIDTHFQEVMDNSSR